MPAVSQAQRRAMFAAAAGKSNLGIPQKVGKEFSEADPGGKLPEKAKDMQYGRSKTMALVTRDMAPDDWRGLVRGLINFLREEAEEPAHQSADAGTSEGARKAARTRASHSGGSPVQTTHAVARQRLASQQSQSPPPNRWQLRASANKKGGDQALDERSNPTMSATSAKMYVTPRSAALRAALYTSVFPRIAQDQRAKFGYDQMTPVLLELRRDQTLAQRRGAILGKLAQVTKGKLAQDADIEDIGNLLDAIAGMIDNGEADMPVDQDVPDAPPPNPVQQEVSSMPAGNDDDDTLAKVKAFLTEQGVDPNVVAQIDKVCGASASPATDEEPDAPAMQPPGAEDQDDDDEEEDNDVAKDNTEAQPDLITKGALDAALAAAVKVQRDIRAAERFVRPWVGELAMDSAETAEDVYRTALKAMNVPNLAALHPSAYRTVLEMTPKPGARQRVAHDAKPADGAKGFFERFPEAARITIN